MVAVYLILDRRYLVLLRGAATVIKPAVGEVAGLVAA